MNSSGIILTPKYQLQLEMASVDNATGTIVTNCANSDKKLEFASFFSGAGITGIEQNGLDGFTIIVTGGDRYDVKFPPPLIQMKTYTFEEPQMTWVIEHDQIGKDYSLTIKKADGMQVLARYESTSDTEITVYFNAPVSGKVNVTFGSEVV